MQISMRMPAGASTALALQAGASTELATSTAVTHFANFSNLYPLSAGASTSIVASLNGVQYASEGLSVPLSPATTVVGVLRTRDSYVDRSRVFVVYQLRDASGNNRVSNSGVSVQATLSTPGLSDQMIGCGVSSLTNPSKHYLGSCTRLLPSSWFAAAGSATATLTLSLNGQVVDTYAVPGTITLHAQPEWYNVLSSAFSQATGFATLPVSPVYAASETFPLTVYAHTGGYAISTFWVWLTIDLSVVEYVSFSQSSLYQTVTLDYGGSSNEVLRFKAVGLQGSTSDSDVTSTQLQLLTVQLRMLSGTSDGYHSNVVSVFVRQFINPGSNPFLEDANGFVFDDRSSGNAVGRIAVKSVADVGIFAYLSSNALANLGVLTGQAASSDITVVSTSDNDLLNTPTTDVSLSVSCSSTDTGAAFSLLGGDESETSSRCSIYIDASHSAGLASGTITVTMGSFTASLPFSIYFPASVVVSTLDTELNQLQDASSIAVPTCGAGSSYQWTSVIVTADGLDATSLVTFAVDDTSVAAVSTGSLWNKLRGVSVGSVNVYLSGRTASFASAIVTVSDTPVSLARLVSRVVTGVSWDGAQEAFTPSVTGLTPFTRSVALQHVLTAEGASGSVFARVEWSDGTHIYYIASQALLLPSAHLPIAHLPASYLPSAYMPSTDSRGLRPSCVCRAQAQARTCHTYRPLMSTS